GGAAPAQVELRVGARLPASSQMILLPAGLLAAHTTAGRPTQILVRAAPGADTRRLTAGLTKLAGRWPGVTVADRSALTATHGEQQQTQAWVNYLLVGMIVAYTAIAVVNTLVLATARRRREFALLQLTGSTRGQVLRMMGHGGCAGRRRRDGARRGRLHHHAGALRRKPPPHRPEPPLTCRNAMRHGPIPSARSRFQDRDGTHD